MKKLICDMCDGTDFIKQEINPLRDRIAEVYSRISEIDSELTMDRK